MCVNGAETNFDYRDVGRSAEAHNPGIQHTYNININNIMLS